MIAQAMLHTSWLIIMRKIRPCKRKVVRPAPYGCQHLSLGATFKHTVPLKNMCFQDACRANALIYTCLIELVWQIISAQSKHMQTHRLPGRALALHSVWNSEWRVRLLSSTSQKQLGSLKMCVNWIWKEKALECQKMGSTFLCIKGSSRSSAICTHCHTSSIYSRLHSLLYPSFRPPNISLFDSGPFIANLPAATWPWVKIPYPPVNIPIPT